jgi:capsular exopolysaccharide synthesis family protein
MNFENGTTGNRSALIPAGMNGFQEGEQSFNAVWRTVAKRKLIILLTTAVIFGAVAAHTLRMKPVYESAVLLQVDPSRSSNLGLEDIAGEKGGDDDTRMATEIKLIESDTVAARVIEAEGLEKRPEFGGPNAASAPVTELKLMTPAARQHLLGAFKGGLKVGVVNGTQLMEIRYRSTDPKLAAQIANAVGEQYMERNFQTHYQGAVQVSDWLSKQMAELQSKAVEAQQKLAEIQKENNILGADENDNIVTDRLKTLSSQVSEAEADRIIKEARFRLSQTGDPELVGSTVNNATLQTLRGQEAEMKSQLAELNAKFGSGYPKVHELQSQLERLKGAIATEIANVGKRMDTEYQAAAKTEGLLRDQLEQAKNDAYKLNEHAVQYSVLRHEVETSRQLYDTLQVKLQVAGVTAGLNSSYISVVDPADVPSFPVAPNVQSNLVMGLLGGLLSGLLLAFVIESFDDTVSTSAELELYTGLPVLCSIPFTMSQRRLKTAKDAPEKIGGVVPALISHPRSQASEAFRGLRSSILLSTPDVQPKVIAVVSSIATEGKTTIAANLGVSFAQQGESVLMIDGDLRRSSLHTNFGLQPSPTGTSTLLTQRTSEPALLTPLEALPNLKLLPAGPHPPNPAELLGSKRMVEVLENFSSEFDRIIIDTPPILSVSDSLAVSHFADAVVLVVRSGIARRKAVLRVRDLLQRANSNLVGVVFNCVNMRLESYYNLQGSKYGKAMNAYYDKKDGEAN